MHITRAGSDSCGSLQSSVLRLPSSGDLLISQQLDPASSCLCSLLPAAKSGLRGGDVPGAGQQNGAWGLLGWETADGAEVGKHVQAGAAALGLAKMRAGHCGAISAPSSIYTLLSWGQASFPVSCSAHGIHPTAQWGPDRRVWSCSCSTPSTASLVLNSSRGCSSLGCPGCPPWDLGAEHWGSPISQPSSLWDLAPLGPQPSLTGN